MDSETTTEHGNKLIAEFMGLKYRWVEYPNKQLNRWEVDKGSYWAAMDYHTSWDWLMPVVEKIQSIYVNNEIRGWHYYDGFGFCITHGDIYRTEQGKGKTLIKAAYNSVIQFIQWYNNQKQNP